MSSAHRPSILVPASKAPRTRRRKTGGLFDFSRGQIITTRGVFTQVIDPAASEQHIMDHPMAIPVSAPVFEISEDPARETARLQRAAKNERQWRKWSEDIIPALLKPYMSLLRETQSLREQIKTNLACTGCSKGRTLDVSCIYFNKIEKLTLCTCTEPALQLLSCGLFPCAPSLPTLAVDLQMLDFVRDLFVNSAPNTTAWCNTLEGFLNARKFKLTTRDSLRGRFANALHWYATLVDTKNLRLRDYLDSIRGSILEMDQGDSETDIDDLMDVDDETMNVPSHIPQHIPTEPPDSPRANEQSSSDCPSSYLRERCPLCFGGKSWKCPTEIVDSIVCIDACFTQKRRKSQGNAWVPPRAHPDTVFVSPAESEAMEAYVEDIRPSQASKAKSRSSQKNKQTDLVDTQDDYEAGLRVPTSVLDECHESFLAADSNRIKASTLFFADTGLMALLCRHDRVLWLVNMTSAGEKQHYALCLLEKLFQHIPETMRVGVLYDIGCQLDRSCRKFNFLSDFLDRIVFGISVFHAYGHQWPCQLIYHPRKCTGFGLTDGEGCERFWSSIKSLIPSLRVSGYYNRIYTLDTQIKHLDQKSMLGLGKWLQRKWIATSNRKREALETLNELERKNITEDILRTEWDLQVIEQTKPLSRQNKHLANKEIDAILTLNQTLHNYKEEAKEYENMIATEHYEDGLDFTDVQAFLHDVEVKIKGTQKTIANKRGKLSVDGRLNLKKLIDDDFLRLRMNALALKQRIRDRLRNRKFELESLERAYRKTVNHLKLDKHVGSQIKRKEPGIQALARKYNKLCDDLKSLIAHKQAPRGAVAPLPIESDGLFKLDVDDDIWQDVGLTDDHDDFNHIPRWLGDEHVRKGIKAVLELDRCNEEQRRLVHERLAMQEWMLEEWDVLQTAIEWSQQDQDIVYQLQEKEKYLLQLCITWQPLVQLINCEAGDSWGPTFAELQEARKYEFTEQFVEKDDDDDEDDDAMGEDRNSDEDVDDAEFFNDVEQLFW